MTRRINQLALSLLTGVVLIGGIAACGEEERKTEVVEGEPIELAGLEYNVQITRFLNPDDNEDAEYLVGQPPPAPDSGYLGVFMVIDNHDEDVRPSATNYVVRDTLGDEFETLPSESPYALEVGADVPAGARLPLPDTTAQSGPNQSSLLIFHVADDVNENRPLKLEIQTYAGTGEVILDV